jgi:hypothetical protein
LIIPKWGRGGASHSPHQHEKKEKKHRERYWPASIIFQTHTMQIRIQRKKSIEEMEIKKKYFKTISGVVSIFFFVGEFLNNHFLNFSPFELENNIFLFKKGGGCCSKKKEKKTGQHKQLPFLPFVLFYSSPLP